jgi:hypothetical protein
MEVSSLPVDYLKFIVANFEPGDIWEEAKRVLKSPEHKDEQKCADLEAEANRILGEKPIDLLRRGFGKPRKRL